MKAGVTKTSKQVNQVGNTEWMSTDINKAEAEMDKSLKEFNEINTSIENILECVSNMIKK